MTRKVPLFRAIAEKLYSLSMMDDSAKRFSWTDEHKAACKDRVEASLDHVLGKLPSGSGIDAGIKLDPSSTSERLVFTLGFHHMDEWGSYAGWTEHKAIVTPTLCDHDGMKLRVTNGCRNDIGDYLHELLDYALREAIDAWEYEAKHVGT